MRNSKKTHFSLSFQLLVGNCLHTVRFSGVSKEFVQLCGVFLSNPATVTIPFGSLLTSACATFSVSSAPSFWQLDYETINPSQFWQSKSTYGQQTRIHEHGSKKVQNRQDTFSRALCAMLQMLLTAVEHPMPNFLHCSKLPTGFTSSEKQFTFPIGY